MSADGWTELLRSVLQGAAQTHASRRRGGHSLIDAHGIGGGWALLTEISQRPDFVPRLRRLVAATYPRAHTARSGLDQVLQVLLLQKPYLAGCCIVEPLMEGLMRVHAARLGLGPGPGRDGRSQPEGSGQPEAAAAAVVGSEAGQQWYGRERNEEEGGDGGGEGGAGEEIEVEQQQQQQDSSDPAAASGRQFQVHSAEVTGMAGPRARRGKVARGGGTGRAAAAAGGGGGSAGDGDLVGCRQGYDRRLLPVSWLLQCFGEVSEELRCLWAAQQQEALRAHVLTAAVRAFARHHHKQCSGSGVMYIPGSPVVQFVRDCFSSTPPHARMQLLEDAMLLSTATATPPPPSHEARPGCDTAAPDAAAAESEPAGVKGARDFDEDPGEDDGGARAAPPLGPASAEGDLVPNKRRGLRTSIDGHGAPTAAQQPPQMSQWTGRQIREPRELDGTGRLPAVTDAGSASEGQRPARDPPVGHDPAPVALPWAALLAHVCEEEEREREQAAQKPTDPWVLSSLALCELLLARGDLFGPPDLHVVAPSLLRCLNALQPHQSADLIARVLNCPTSAPMPPGDEGLTAAEPAAHAASEAGRTYHGAAGPLSAACNELDLAGWGIDGGGPHGGEGNGGGRRGGLAAALALLRGPVREGRALLPRRLAQPAQPQKRGKKRGRQGGSTAAAVAGAEEPPQLVAARPPPPLTALWLLSHAVPVLMRPLEVEQDLLPDQRKGEPPLPGSSGGEGGDAVGAEVLDRAGRTRALACLAALLRQPALLLPEERPEELLLAARVLAIRVGELGSPGQQGQHGPTEAAGPPEAGVRRAAGSDAAQRRLAALLCSAFRLGADAFGGARNAATGQCESPGSQLLKELTGLYPRSGFQMPGAAGPRRSTPASRSRRTHESDWSADLLAEMPVLWPAVRPLLALLDNLPAGSHVAAAVHALLVAALLQRHEPRRPEGTALEEADPGSAPIVPDGTAGLPGAAVLQAPAAVPGDGNRMEVGAAAAEEVLGILVAEAAAGGGSGSGARSSALAAASTSAVRFGAAATKVDVLRLVCLAAGAASRETAGEPGGGAAAAAEGMMPLAEGSTRPAADSAAAASASMSAYQYSPATAYAASWGAFTLQAAGGLTPPPLVRLVSERLGGSVAAVVQALIPAQRRHPQVADHKSGGTAPRAELAAAPSVATALARVAPQALLVRLAGAVLFPPDGTDSAAGVARVPIQDTEHGWDSDVAAAAAGWLVQLLKRSPAAVSALGSFAAKAEPASGAEGAHAASSSLPGPLAAGTFSAIGVGGAIAGRGAVRGAVGGLDPRMTGLQLVQQTHQALRQLAAAVCGDGDGLESMEIPSVHVALPSPACVDCR